MSHDPNPAKVAAVPETTPQSQDPCDLPIVTHTRALIDNIPYLLMLGLGAALFHVSLAAPWGALTAAAYVLYGLAGAVWIMVFVCPYCHFFDTRLCPCGYGVIAARLRPRAAGERFAAQFRKHIPVIVPLWFLPLAIASLPLVTRFSWWLVALLGAFVLNAFVVLPLISRMYGCAECPQKATCPWMGGCKGS